MIRPFLSGTKLAISLSNCWQGGHERNKDCASPADVSSAPVLWAWCRRIEKQTLWQWWCHRIDGVKATPVLVPALPAATAGTLYWANFGLQSNRYFPTPGASIRLQTEIAVCGMASEEGGEEQSVAQGPSEQLPRCSQHHSQLEDRVPALMPLWVHTAQKHLRQQLMNQSKEGEGRGKSETERERRGETRGELGRNSTAANICCKSVMRRAWRWCCRSIKYATLPALSYVGYHHPYFGDEESTTYKG